MSSNKLKVMQLASPENLYGAERWVLALINNIDTSKVETIVAVIRDEPSQKAPICIEAEKMGFPIKTFDCYGKINFTAVKKVKRYLIENQIRILHTHHYKTDIIGLLAVIGTECKVVSTPHGWTKHADLKLWCYEILNRFIFPFFDAVVPLSKEMYKNLKFIPGAYRKLSLIENGVDISEIDNVTQISTKMLTLKDQKIFIIGYIGRLVPGKGLDILFRSIAQLRNFDYHLVLIGQGDHQEELEKLAIELGVSGRSDFLGFQKDRLAFLKGFDVFVLPSKSEGIPRCLMETLAAEIPVIASDIPGCRDLIKHQETGLLFSPSRPHELAEKITSLRNKKERQNIFRKNGRNFVMERFSAKRMAERYVELFETLSP